MTRLVVANPSWRINPTRWDIIVVGVLSSSLRMWQWRVSGDSCARSIELGLGHDSLSHSLSLSCAEALLSIDGHDLYVSTLVYFKFYLSHTTRKSILFSYVTVRDERWRACKFFISGEFCFIFLSYFFVLWGHRAEDVVDNISMYIGYNNINVHMSPLQNCNT